MTNFNHSGHVALANGICVESMRYRSRNKKELVRRINTYSPQYLQKSTHISLIFASSVSGGYEEKGYVCI